MDRLVKVPIAKELWRQLLTEGNQIHMECIQGLPEGAAFVMGYQDANTLVLVYRHETFEPVAEIRAAPELNCVYKNLD